MSLGGQEGAEPSASSGGPCQGRALTSRRTAMLTARPATRNGEPDSSAHGPSGSVTKENTAQPGTGPNDPPHRKEGVRPSWLSAPFAERHPHLLRRQGPDPHPPPLGERIQLCPSPTDTGKTQFSDPVLKDFQQCISISKIRYEKPT